MEQHGSLRKPNRNNMMDDEEVEDVELTLACVAVNPNISTRATEAQENPHALIPRRNQVRFGFNVFCGILGNRLVGPIIFYGNLTAQRYLEILQTSVEDLLDDLPLAQNVRIWYQQDGAPAHNARNV
ncbi:hypothetical protein CBL_20187, partial [Carabus blaptoides fortunei]